jgi:hypothetical protein
LSEFKVEEKVVNEALAKADSHLKKLNTADISLKQIQFNGKVAEFGKSTIKNKKTLLGSLFYRTYAKIENLKSLTFHNDIIDNYSSCVNLFKCKDDANYVFYIDNNHNLNMSSFDDDGMIFQELFNSLKYSGTMYRDASQITQFKIAQLSSYFVIHVDFRVFKTTGDYVNRTLCGHDIKKPTSYVKGLFFVINQDFGYVRHNYDFPDQMILHMTANSSMIIWVDTDYNYNYFDLNLVVLTDKPLDEITTQVGNAIVDVQMSDKYVYFLCNDEKLKIFEIKSGNLVKEIKTTADQIKLVSNDSLILFDSVKRTICQIEQFGKLRKQKDFYLSEECVSDLLINRDKSNILVFYNSKSMNYISLDLI